MKAKCVVLLIALIPPLILICNAQSSPVGPTSPKETQTLGYWIDTSGLMWTGKDSGKDVNWKQAMKYCQNLRMGGYSDWRLPTRYELQDIYADYLKSPGRAGPGKGRDVTWHVEGELFLTGHEWSSTRGLDDRGHPSEYPWYFDFNEGKPMNFDEPSSGKRALCVRRAGK